MDVLDLYIVYFVRNYLKKIILYNKYNKVNICNICVNGKIKFLKLIRYNFFIDVFRLFF